MEKNPVRKTLYLKLLFAILFILLPFVGFYMGIQYQKTLSRNEIESKQNQDINKSSNNNLDDEKNDTSNNRNRSCGKSTILLIQTNKTKDEISNYLTKNKLSIKESGGIEYTNGTVIEVGVGKDTYWINKFKEDGMGTAIYDTVGCDFIDGNQ